MQLIKTIRGIFIKESNARALIVERLLNNRQITTKEAVDLLQSTIHFTVNIADNELSSGAKIVLGDDNETNSR